MQEKELALAKKESAGLHEDNERLNRMYQLLQKEAFYGVEKLKKESVDLSNEAGQVKSAGGGVSAVALNKKVGYQPLVDKRPMYA